jgi:hypothetical protein
MIAILTRLDFHRSLPVHGCDEPFTRDQMFDLLKMVCERSTVRLRAFRSRDGVFVDASNVSGRAVLTRPVDLEAIRLAHGPTIEVIDALERRLDEIVGEFRGVADLFDSPNWSLDV